MLRLGFWRRICRYRSTSTVVLPEPGPAVTEICFLISYAAAACSGCNSRCCCCEDIIHRLLRCPICFSLSSLCEGVFLDSQRQAEAYRTLGFLPFNPISIVATDRGEVTKPACLLLLGRIHSEVPGAHVIKKIPNLSDHISTNLLPLIIADNGAGPGADSGISQRAGAMKPFVTAFIATSDHVVTTTGDRMIGKD